MKKIVPCFHLILDCLLHRLLKPAAEMLVVEGWFVNTEFVRLFWFCIVMYFRLGTRTWAFLFSFGGGGNPT